MAICGHQFRGGDESDWVLSTSVGGLEGSATANRILRELFKKHCSEITMKRQRTVVEKTTEERSSGEQNENLIVRKLTGMCDLEDFDESQHLNGCPVKWLYKKRLLDKRKMYKVGRLCYRKSENVEEIRKEKCKSVRDKTPIEVKIHKINLMEKYTSNYEECPGASWKPHLGGKAEENPAELETHRKKLAAKLNWKLHDESQEECQVETSSEIRHNYLPPRPLLGLKPLLSVLLAPHQETNCCSLGIRLQENSPKEKLGASLTIQSLDLPFFSSETRPRPRTARTPRWGSKSSRLTKKLQIPNQITIDLGRNQKTTVSKPDSQLKMICYNPPTRKLSQREKQTKSLSSLFYELKDKTNNGNQTVEYFEEMIRDLTMEEGQFKINRFLNATLRHFPSPEEERNVSEIKEKLMETSSTSENEMNLRCGKILFSQKPLRSKKPEPRKEIGKKGPKMGS